MKKIDQLHHKAKQAKVLLAIGEITLEEAKEQARPFIDQANKKAVELAKKFQVRPKLMNLSSFLR